jgi:SAM-dependent methyltransferase
MNAHVPALQRSLPDVVEEYDAKRAALPEILKAVHRAGAELETAATIAGTYGNTTISTKAPEMWHLEASLLKSAWKHVYEGLQMPILSSPNDKRKWETTIEKPPEFTMDNIRATFGPYLMDPRASILKAFAEVFCGLDPYYKSHEKLKIGVKGLPKRVVLGSFSDYGSGYGVDQLKSILNALAAYQGKPLPTYAEIDRLVGRKAPCEHALTEAWTQKDHKDEETRYPARGVWLKRYKNGNGHLYFDHDTLVDINKAMAEFYGPALGDTTGWTEEPRESTAVAKDLQFFRTPKSVIDEALYHIDVKGKLVLEPSCGDGAFMDAIRRAGGAGFGIEYDAGRVAMCRAKGHKVQHGNFLETVPVEKFDVVLMNPPFYGRHYAKHVRHAFKFLKPGGTLKAILPATARYDHGELDDMIPKSRWGDSAWRDLPVGSFSESGTNVNTTILTLHKPKEAT